MSKRKLSRSNFIQTLNWINENQENPIANAALDLEIIIIYNLSLRKIFFAKIGDEIIQDINGFSVAKK